MAPYEQEELPDYLLDNLCHASISFANFTCYKKKTNILKISQLNLAISFSSSYSLYKDTNLPILTTLFNTTGTHNIQLFMWPSISLSSSVIAINTLTIQLFSTRLQARVIFSPVLSFLPEQTHRETTRAGQKHTSFSSN